VAVNEDLQKKSNPPAQNAPTNDPAASRIAGHATAHADAPAGTAGAKPNAVPLPAQTLAPVGNNTMNITTNQFGTAQIQLIGGTTPPNVTLGGNGLGFGNQFVVESVVPDENNDGGGTVNVNYYPTGNLEANTASTDTINVTTAGGTITINVNISLPTQETENLVGITTQAWDGKTIN
jgi:hypothetical protein